MSNKPYRTNLKGQTAFIENKRTEVIYIPLFTEEQVQAAKSIDLLTFLRRHEPGSIRRCGAREHCLVRHDSFKLSNGKWYWHSRGFGGHSAYDYLTKVQGMGFKDAIQTLLDGGIVSTSITDIARSPPIPSRKEPLVLPIANKNNDAVIAYLQGRGIEKSVIRRCINNGSLYESANDHRCVFVGFSNGNARYACIRSIKGSIKKDVKNSDKGYSFVFPSSNKKSHDLAVFESPIDALSHASIYLMGDYKWDGHRLSLGGLSSLALVRFLERHTEIRNVQLCLDHDKAGKEATGRVIRELLSDKRFSNVKIAVAQPPLGNDFNDTLLAVRQMQTDKPKQNRSKEADFLV